MQTNKYYPKLSMNKRCFIMEKERELVGPGSYEKYNKISIISQQKYFFLLKSQIVLLLFIAFLSIFPPFSLTFEQIKRFVELFLIILVLITMMLQYKSNYVDGWQNARYLAESSLSNAWLFIWKCEPFKGDKHTATNVFVDVLEKFEEDVPLNQFISLVPNQGDEISDWMIEFRDSEIDVKKESYIKYRLDNQISWYSNKADFNQKRSALWFKVGLALMVIGAVLTLMLIYDIIPDWSFLGFFTTTAVSVFSWTQAKRNDELKITYAIASRDLSRFKAKMKNLSLNENEFIDLVSNIEKSISREHKLWLTSLK